MLVVLAVTFGAVSVSARVGYEVGAESGILWGAIVGLALSLVAMWAFSRWWKEVAVVASVLAAVGVVYLIVAGLVMLFVNFVVGMPMTVSEGMCCLGGGIAVFAAGAALFALYLVAL
jgi:tetrahydromethanopterin S-methyltransferase subunit G